MITLVCMLERVAKNAFSVDIEENDTIDDLKKAIMTKRSYDLKRVDVDQLNLYCAKKNEGKWLELLDIHPLALIEEFLKEGIKLNPMENICTYFADAPEMVIHVLVQLPLYDVVWYGKHGSRNVVYGIDLDDERTLSRNALINDIIRRLDDMHFLFIKSPSMTGKSSLATLVCRELANRSKDQNNTSIIFSFVASQIFENRTFLDMFKYQCGVEWSYAKSLSLQGKTVYFVADHVHKIFEDPVNSSIRKSEELWDLIKLLFDNNNLNIRILMLASYGPDLQCVQFPTSLDIPSKFVLNIEDINFSPEEIEKYVNKWFIGARDLEDNMKAFCDRLKWLTNGHVGLCTTAIRKLNEAYTSLMERGDEQLSTQEWVRRLEHGYLQPDSYYTLFDALISNRAMSRFKARNSEELEVLERLVCGADISSNIETIELCIMIGVLVQTEDQIKFSSPLMWRFFVRKRAGYIEHEIDGPKTLREMIEQVIETIDYNSIHEKAWEMEFYKALYRCAPSNFMTSANLDAIFTIHCGNGFWGIKLLREGDILSEHIGRYASGGRYAPLRLTDFCLIDFRRMDLTTQEKINDDSALSEKLFIVCYDATFTNVSLFNSQLPPKVIRSST